ncbi:hypothetical protein NFJ02_22g47810 [Pycnococcus provasolii]
MSRTCCGRGRRCDTSRQPRCLLHWSAACSLASTTSRRRMSRTCCGRGLRCL